MAIDTATDPNVAALKKRLYGQVPGAIPDASGGAAVPSVSPDFAQPTARPRPGTGPFQTPRPVSPWETVMTEPPKGSPWGPVMTPGPGGQVGDEGTVTPPIIPPLPTGRPSPIVPKLQPPGTDVTQLAGSGRSAAGVNSTMGAPAGGAYTPVPVAPPVLGPPTDVAPPPAPVGPPTGPPAAAGASAGAGSTADAVAANYASLGVQPTGPGSGPTDAAYFQRRIDETGGMTPENQAYWFGPNGRIAREIRGEVPPETGDAETPKTTRQSSAASSLVAPTSSASNASAITGEVAGTNHRPGDGTGVPGVYDWDNAGRPVDAMGHPYMGALQDGSPNPWTSGGGAPAATPATPAVPDFQGEIRKQLMARLAELGTPVNEQSSGIAGAVSGARDEATRASEQERTALAERLYAQGGGGLNSNALTQQIQQSGEKNASSLGGLRANLMMQEYARKQTALQQTLSLAVQSGDAEAARAAQKAIADLQAQLQREGFAIDIAKYTAFLNQNAVLQGLGG